MWIGFLEPTPLDFCVVWLETGFKTKSKISGKR
jgi:hypothetical protein